jgi:hypothetical protein
VDLTPSDSVLEEILSRIAAAAGIEPIIEADVLELEVIGDGDDGEP